MNEINKDELLDLKKWQRLFFMVIYSFAINAVVNILIILAVLQSFFYLFTSRTNAQVQSVNNWLQVFFNDTATTEIYTLSLHDALPICFFLWLYIHLQLMLLLIS